MAQILIWGKKREILADELPAGAAAEVASLAALKTAVDGRRRALVLADPRRLEAEKDGVMAWLRAGAVAQVVLLAVTDAADGEELRRRLPFVDGLLPRPVTTERLIERAVEALHGRRQAERALRRKHDELSELNKIGVALSAERDIDKLLELILSKSREITGADAGSLYLVEREKSENGNGDRLRFKLPQNDTIPVSDFEEYTMPLDDTSIAGHVAVTGEPVNVDDAYHLPEGSPYAISRSFDETSGYRTKSMLVVPMRDHQDVVIGVVQLINKKRGRSVRFHSTSQIEREAIPFTKVDADLARSLASQAAVAFENADLIDRIRTLFDQFIRRSVAAVELRDPTTAGHSERVAILSVGLIEKVDAVSTGPLAELRFSLDQVKELRYAALLHDFGKVAVQEKYLRKEKKLYASQMITIRQRFAFILKCMEAEHLRAQLALKGSGRARARARAALEAEYRRKRLGVRRLLGAVERANVPTVVAEESVSAVQGLPARRLRGPKDEERFPVERWARPPFLSSAELKALSVRRGSLTAEEKDAINEHVQQTYEFLDKMPWTGDLKRIPQIAWAHHEKLDGSGYPRGLKGAEIPVQSKMMTIADIYDALVAQDRPYKKAVKPERALDILQHDATKGLLDGDLLRVFVEARIYDLPEFRALIKRRT